MTVMGFFFAWAAISALAGIIVSALCLWQYLAEVRAWNRGICRQNGLPWRYITRTSQGCRFYTAGDRELWLTASIETRYPAK